MFSLMNDRKKIGTIIRRRREAKHLSLRGLGKRTGIYYNTLYSLEIGRGRLTTAQLAALATVLGSDLLKEVVAASRPSKKAVAR